MPTDIRDGVHHRIVDTIIEPLSRQQLSPTSQSKPGGRRRRDTIPLLTTAEMQTYFRKRGIKVEFEEAGKG
jgi:hypothetical protein